MKPHEIDQVVEPPKTVVVQKTHRMPSAIYLALGCLVHIGFIGAEFSTLSLWSPVIILLWPFYLIWKALVWFFTAGIFWIAGMIVVVALGLWVLSRYDRFMNNRNRRRREKNRITQ